MTDILDYGYVKLVQTWGEDSSIIEAARMSTDKGFQGWGPRHSEFCSFTESEPSGCVCEPKAGDEKLLRFLWEHKHHTPFEMAGAIIEVQAPLFVFREWHRHRTQSYNELSGRYTQLPDLYYIPSIERLKAGKQATKNKQSSEEGFTDESALLIQAEIKSATNESRNRYEYLLSMGVSRELARLVIPVNQYSRMRAGANLRNWLGFLSLRMDPAAQWEIRQYANAVGTLIAEHFPRTWSLFNETRPDRDN